jgi:hypothetical protein
MGTMASVPVVVVAVAAVRTALATSASAVPETMAAGVAAAALVPICPASVVTADSLAAVAGLVVEAATAEQVGLEEAAEDPTAPRADSAAPETSLEVEAAALWEVRYLMTAAFSRQKTAPSTITLLAEEPA